MAGSVTRKRLDEHETRKMERALNPSWEHLGKLFLSNLRQEPVAPDLARATGGAGMNLG